MFSVFKFNYLKWIDTNHNRTNFCGRVLCKNPFVTICGPNTDTNSFITTYTFEGFRQFIYLQIYESYSKCLIIFQSSHTSWFSCLYVLMHWNTCYCMRRVFRSFFYELSDSKRWQSFVWMTKSIATLKSMINSIIIENLINPKIFVKNHFYKNFMNKF